MARVFLCRMVWVLGLISAMLPSSASAIGLAAHRAEAGLIEPGDFHIASLLLPYARADLTYDPFARNGFDLDVVHLAMAYRFSKTWDALFLTGADRGWTDATDRRNRFNVMGNYIKLAYIRATDVFGAGSNGTFGMQLSPYYLLVEEELDMNWIASGVPMQTSMLSYYNSGLSGWFQFDRSLQAVFYVSGNEGWLNKGDPNNGLSYAAFLKYRVHPLLNVTLAGTLFTSPGRGTENLLTLSAGWTNRKAAVLLEAAWFERQDPGTLLALNGILYGIQGPRSALGFGVSTRFPLSGERWNFYMRIYGGNSDFQGGFLSTIRAGGAFGETLFTAGPYYDFHLNELRTGVFYERLSVTETSPVTSGFTEYNEIAWKWQILF